MNATTHAAQRITSVFAVRSSLMRKMKQTPARKTRIVETISQTKSALKPAVRHANIVSAAPTLLSVPSKLGTNASRNRTKFTATIDRIIHFTDCPSSL